MNKFKYKKNYGQVFLKDTNIVDKIIKKITATKNDLIVEIGPGTGFLTKKLKTLNSNLLAYEIDLETKPYLDAINVKVIYGDFLKQNIKNDINLINHENLYIVGNLPYYITTRIIKKITEESKPKEMILMVQKEVAERLSAKPGNKEYGFITVFLNYYYDIELLFVVNKTSFYPVPKVDSAVIKLTAHNKFKEINDTKFVKLLKDSFMHKRKTLLNNLKNYDKNTITNVLLKNNIKLDVRAEELSISVFLEIAKNI